MKRGQLELFPVPAHRWQSVDDIEAMGERAAAQAQQFHADYPNDPRATRAAFSAMILFGAAEVLRQRVASDPNHPCRSRR